MNTVVTGTVFGAALVASGMYSPHLIASQFTLERWNMLQTFLTATGCSALTLEILSQLGHTVPVPRSWSSAGILRRPSSSLSTLDGNVLGGVLLGAGMSLSSSCPGMVFPQLALGVPSAPAIIAGGGLGGIFWSAVLRLWIAEWRKRAVATTPATTPPPTTLAGLFKASHTATFLVFEVPLAVIVATVAKEAPSAPSPLHPVTGGLAIAGAQLISLLARGSLLGVSTCYEQFGDWVVFLARGGGLSRRTTNDHKTSQQQQPGTSAMLFAVAITAGAWIFARTRPEMALLVTEGGSGGANLARFFAGGFIMAVGSRIAGGCASGHGISGMALMSSSSLVTMFVTFTAAISVSRLWS